MNIVIPGYTTDKVPGVVAQSEFGAGRLSVGDIPLTCNLFGTMGSGGTAEPGVRELVTTEEEADAFFEARSEIARMCHAALGVPGAQIWACASAEANGAVAAQLPLVIGGSWSAGGELGLQLGKEIIRVTVAPSHTPTTFGDAVVERVGQAQSGRLFCTAVNTAGRVVLTVFSKGERGNQHIAFLDTSKLPAGMTVAFEQNSAVSQVGGGPTITVAGTHTVDTDWEVTLTVAGSNGTAEFSLEGNGASVATGVTVPETPFTYAIPDTSLVITFGDGMHVLNTVHSWKTTAKFGNGGQPFWGGTGTEDIEPAMDGTESETLDYIGLAQNDAVNVALVEEKVQRKAAWDIGKLEFYFVCRHRGLTDAIALGQTTMNDVRGTCLWPQWHVEHPSRTAARVAALASTVEGGQPNFNYDDVEIPGAAPHFAKGDSPNRTTLNVALSNSVTPLVTVDGRLVIVRAITSRSLAGSTPNYNTYDRGDAAVPTRVRKELVAIGLQLKAENPWMGPDIGDDMPPEGRLTPRLFNSKVSSALQRWAGPEFNWLTDVELPQNQPRAIWDGDNKRIMAAVSTVVMAQSHQLGIIVRQTAA